FIASSKATLAPSRASNMAAALPLPMPSPREPAPVTIATLSLRPIWGIPFTLLVSADLLWVSGSSYPIKTRLIYSASVFYSSLERAVWTPVTRHQHSRAQLRYGSDRTVPTERSSRHWGVCPSGMRTTSPSSASLTVIWQNRRELGWASAASSACWLPASPGQGGRSSPASSHPQ